MNGISLVDFAAVLTALGGILGAVFAYTNYQGNARDKIHEGRIADLQKARDEDRVDFDERLSRVREEADKSLCQLRQEFERQLTDVKQAMTHQSQTIERQEIMLSDYSRHVSKLERLMAANGIEIPDFETSVLRGGKSAAS